MIHQLIVFSTQWLLLQHGSPQWCHEGQWNLCQVSDLSQHLPGVGSTPCETALFKSLFKHLPDLVGHSASVRLNQVETAAKWSMLTFLIRLVNLDRRQSCLTTASTSFRDSPATLLIEFQSWRPGAGETSDSVRPSQVQSSHTASLPITLRALWLCSIIGHRRVKGKKHTHSFLSPLPWPDSWLRASPPWNEILHDTRRVATNSNWPCRWPDCAQSVWKPPSSAAPWSKSSLHLTDRLFRT